MRLTRKPGQSRTTIGVLPMRLARATSVTTVASPVLLAADDLDQLHAVDRVEEVQAGEVLRDASTDFAMRVMEMVEVFEARIAPGRKTFCTSR